MSPTATKAPRSLATIAPGTRVIVYAVSGPPALTGRLAMLGLRPGAEITPMHRSAGGGRVLDVSGARIALGRDLLDALQVSLA